MLLLYPIPSFALHHLVSSRKGLGENALARAGVWASHAAGCVWVSVTSHPGCMISGPWTTTLEFAKQTWDWRKAGNLSRSASRFCEARASSYLLQQASRTTSEAFHTLQRSHISSPDRIGTARRRRRGKGLLLYTNNYANPFALHLVLHSVTHQASPPAPLGLNRGPGDLV